MPIIWWSQLLYLSAIVIASFLVIWVFAGLLRFPRPGYVAVLAIMTGTFFVGYLQWSGANWRMFLSYHLLWGMIGAIISGLVAIIAVDWLVHWKSLSRFPAPGPQGMRLVLDLIYEGIIHGAAEATLLSVLPVQIIWHIFSSFTWSQQWPGTAIVALLALAASVLVICAHHLGYKEFRCSLLFYVTAGNALFTLAYILTMNPFAAIGGHILMHIGATFLRVEVPLCRKTKNSNLVQIESV